MAGRDEMRHTPLGIRGTGNFPQVDRRCCCNSHRCSRLCSLGIIKYASLTARHVSNLSWNRVMTIWNQYRQQDDGCLKNITFQSSKVIMRQMLRYRSVRGDFLIAACKLDLRWDDYLHHACLLVGLLGSWFCCMPLFTSCIYIALYMYLYSTLVIVTFSWALTLIFISKGIQKDRITRISFISHVPFPVVVVVCIYLQTIYIALYIYFACKLWVWPSFEVFTFCISKGIQEDRITRISYIYRFSLPVPCCCCMLLLTKCTYSPLYIIFILQLSDFNLHLDC